MTDKEIAAFLNEGFHDDTSVGVVLAGGGGKGAYQAGVLKALKENGVLNNIEAISGASIGAVNSLLFAMNDIELMYKAWSDINMQTVFDFEIDTTNGIRPHFSRDEMLKLFEKYIQFEKIKDCGYDIICSLSRINREDVTKEPECIYKSLSNCDVETAKQRLLATTALPVIYSPVELDDGLYEDGGVTDNTPVKPLYDKGIKRIIVISNNHAYKPDIDKYSECEIICIKPSHDLGDLIDGTLNFTDKAIDFREELGYKDGLRAIKIQIEKNEAYKNMESFLIENDYKEITMKLKTEHNINNISNHINSNIKYFTDLEKKYLN